MYNWVINGDAELGSCTLDSNFVSPINWNYSRATNQMSYASPIGAVGYNAPGPR